jgi:hypothetical protein
VFGGWNRVLLVNPLTMWTPGIPFITVMHTPLHAGEVKLVISATNPTASSGL